MKVLAVGATGPRAGLVLPQLLARGLEVRALVRDERKAAAARAAGAQETAVGDLTRPETLRAAARGVDGVFHLNPAFAPDEAAMGVAVVRAAAEASVAKFVFSSVYHPSLSLTNHAGKRPVEEALYDSGLDFTILQPAMFVQMLSGLWQDAVQHGVMAGPYSQDAKMSYVDYRDVTEVAASAFVREDLAFGTFELSAAGMLSRTDLAALATELLGRPARADHRDRPLGDAPGPVRGRHDADAGPVRRARLRRRERPRAPHHPRSPAPDGARVLRGAGAVTGAPRPRPLDGEEAGDERRPPPRTAADPPGRP